MATKHDKKHRTVNGGERARTSGRVARGSRGRRVAAVDEVVPEGAEPVVAPEVDESAWAAAAPVLGEEPMVAELTDEVEPALEVAEAEPTEPAFAGEPESAAPDEVEAMADEPEEGETPVRKAGDEPQTFLAMYFRDMAELEVLRPEEEFETARNIETLEVELWKLVLGHAPAAAAMVTVIERAMTKPWSEFPAYVAMAEKQGAKAKAKGDKFEALVESLAPKLRELDIDRLFIDAATAELHRLSAMSRAGDAATPAFASAKGYEAHLRSVDVKVFKVKTAKNAFVKANLRLVVSIARRFNHGRLPLADLIQEGNIGLMKAVERYDYRRGFRFSTYASWWIRHAISRALADKGRAVRLPVHMIDAYHRIAKSERELQSKLDRPATTEEIAQAAGMETEKLEKMRTFLNETPVSLDRPISDDDGRRLIDVLVDPQDTPAAPEQMVTTETHLEMLKLLQTLKPIEADILRKRFGLTSDREQTLKEIGDEYRLSRERVRQLQEQALGKMRKAMSKMEA